MRSAIMHSESINKRVILVGLIAVALTIVSSHPAYSQPTSPEDAVGELGFVKPKSVYTNIFLFGGYLARVKRSLDVDRRTDVGSASLSAMVEIVPATEDPGTGFPVASFEIPINAAVYQSGYLLVTVEMGPTDPSDWPYTYETSIEVWNLSDPTAPERGGQLTTDRLKPNFPLRQLDDANSVSSVPGGLVFLERQAKRHSLEVLNLRNPNAPTLGESIDLGAGNKRVSMLVDGSDIWISYRRWTQEAETDQLYPPYYIKKIILSVISRPQVEDPINVPGSLLAIDDDTIYTQEIVLGQEMVETVIAKSVLYEGLAYLQAEQSFVDQIVERVVLDSEGHLLVSHRFAWGFQVDVSPQHYLSVLDAEGSDLTVLAQVLVAEQAHLIAAPPSRAVFQVPGGLLIFNIDNPESPFPQAYFPTVGWPVDPLHVEDQIILIIRGGIYSFDLDEFNL